MKPAERIPLLKKLATALSAEDMSFSEMRLILRQFGFTSENVWGEDANGFSLAPDRFDYALHHVENSGTDEKRLELARYLAPGDDGTTSAPSTPASVGSGPWKGENTVRLFISHTHANAKLAGEIKKHLGRFLIESFVAHDDIEPSEKWMRVIESALLTCHAVIAILTPDFRESQWCDQEIGFCLARSLLVVPLMREVNPHGFLSEFQGVKLNERTRPQAAANDVFRILATRPETSERMVPSIVRRFAASESFDETREAFTFLARIPKDAWTTRLIYEVRAAEYLNSQIKDANLSDGKRVSDALNKLLLPTEKRLDIVGDIPF